MINVLKEKGNVQIRFLKKSMSISKENNEWNPLYLEFLEFVVSQ